MADRDFAARVEMLPPSPSSPLISALEVSTVITSRLKMGKAADAYSCYAEHFIYASDIIAEPISRILSSMLRLKHCPSSSVCSLFFPSLKDSKADPNLLGNYHGIAISPVISRILEAIILSRHIELLTTSPSQHGYKKHHSCASCVRDLLGVVNQFTKSKSRVFLLFLMRLKRLTKSFLAFFVPIS